MKLNLRYSDQLKDKLKFTAIAASLVAGTYKLTHMFSPTTKFVGLQPYLIASLLIQILNKFSSKIKASLECKNHAEYRTLIKEISYAIAGVEIYMQSGSVINKVVNGVSYAALIEGLSKIEKTSKQDVIPEAIVTQVLIDILPQVYLILTQSNPATLMAFGALQVLLFITGNEISKETETVLYYTENGSVKKLQLPKFITGFTSNRDTLLILQGLSCVIPTIILGKKAIVITGLTLFINTLLVGFSKLNTTKMTNTMRKLNCNFDKIRPGKETKQYLDGLVKKFIKHSIPINAVFYVVPVLISLIFKTNFIPVSQFTCYLTERVEEYSRNLKSIARPYKGILA